MSQQGKVYHRQGDQGLVVADGGEIDIQSGGKFTVNGTQLTGLTAQLTTITPADAAGTPDYAIQAVTNTTPYGFADAQELITLLYVIQNLQVRLAEVESRLESLGAVAAN